MQPWLVERENWFDMRWFCTVCAHLFILHFHAAVVRRLFVWARPHWQVSVKEDVVILCNIYYRHTSQAYWSKMSWQQRAEQNKTKLNKLKRFIFICLGWRRDYESFTERNITTAQVETRQRTRALAASSWPQTESYADDRWLIEGLWTAHKTAPCQMWLVCNPPTRALKALKALRPVSLALSLLGLSLVSHHFPSMCFKSLGE